MAYFSSISIIIFVSFIGVVQSAQWNSTSLPDGKILYACAGDTVTLTWQYTLTSEEVLGDTDWLYDGQSQELVAMSSRGHFFPTPTFSQRVTRVDNAGLSLSRVTVSDSGNYSVEVTFNTQGGTSRTVLRRTAVLYVSDRLMTTDGVLHITLLRDPVYDSVSKQWILQLQCGNFIFKDIPPIDVEWTTPSGEVHNSTSFSNGNFYLSVPMPIESGSYTCRIPAHLSARACLHGNGTSEGRATVTVESSEARLLLLEKENSDLKTTVVEQANRLSRITALQTLQNQTVEDLTSRLTALQTSLTEDVQRLNSQLSATTTRLEKIEDVGRNQVAFQATGLLSSTITANGPVVFDQMVYNQGNAYNPLSGYFTAPYSGLYFFIAKTAAGSNGNTESHHLMVDDLSIDWTQNRLYADPSPVHGVVHLTQGQRVYVKCDSSTLLYEYYSAFTGFLLSRDL